MPKLPQTALQAGASSQRTHRPNPNGGTICGLRVPPSDARSYSEENPTCPECFAWLERTRAVTYAKHGEPAEHGSSALEEAEAYAPPPAPPPPPPKGDQATGRTLPPKDTSKDK
jgi:hypothetical protein